jgi:uncharacterized protein YcaQ
MKFGITKYELFALTHHLVNQRCPNPEYGRKRLRTWDEFGVSDLADTLAGAQAMGGEIPIAEYRDRKTMHIVDLNTDVIDHVISGLAQEIVGAWADTLLRLRERLEQLRDKKYELPAELRPLKAVPDGQP